MSTLDKLLATKTVLEAVDLSQPIDGVNEFSRELSHREQVDIFEWITSYILVLQADESDTVKKKGIAKIMILLETRLALDVYTTGKIELNQQDSLATRTTSRTLLKGLPEDVIKKCEPILQQAIRQAEMDLDETEIQRCITHALSAHHSGEALSRFTEMIYQLTVLKLKTNERSVKEESQFYGLVKIVPEVKKALQDTRDTLAEYLKN